MHAHCESAIYNNLIIPTVCLACTNLLIVIVLGVAVVYSGPVHNGLSISCCHSPAALIGSSSKITQCQFTIHVHMFLSNFTLLSWIKTTKYWCQLVPVIKKISQPNDITYR